MTTKTKKTDTEKAEPATVAEKTEPAALSLCITYHAATAPDGAPQIVNVDSSGPGAEGVLKGALAWLQDAPRRAWEVDRAARLAAAVAALDGVRGPLLAAGLPESIIASAAATFAAAVKTIEAETYQDKRRAPLASALPTEHGAAKVASANVMQANHRKVYRSPAAFAGRPGAYLSACAALVGFPSGRGAPSEAGRRQNIASAADAIRAFDWDSVPVGPSHDVAGTIQGPGTKHVVAVLDRFLAA